VIGEPGGTEEVDVVKRCGELVGPGIGRGEGGGGGGGGGRSAGRRARMGVTGRSDRPRTIVLAPAVSRWRAVYNGPLCEPK
jgi:hypothetical protein